MTLRNHKVSHLSLNVSTGSALRSNFIVNFTKWYIIFPLIIIRSTSTILLFQNFSDTLYTRILIVNLFKKFRHKWLWERLNKEWSKGEAWVRRNPPFSRYPISGIRAEGHRQIHFRALSVLLFVRDGHLADSAYRSICTQQLGLKENIALETWSGE